MCFFITYLLYTTLPHCSQTMNPSFFNLSILPIGISIRHPPHNLPDTGTSTGNILSCNTPLYFANILSSILPSSDFCSWRSFAILGVISFTLASYFSLHSLCFCFAFCVALLSAFFLTFVLAFLIEFVLFKIIPLCIMGVGQ